MESVDGDDERLSCGAADPFFPGIGNPKEVDTSVERIKDFAIGVTVERHTFSRLKLLFVN